MKFSSSSLLLLATTSATLATARLCTGMDYPCTSGVLVLGARGTGGDNDPNSTDPNYDDLQGMETVAQALINKAGSGSYCRALPYAASPGLNYFASIAHGIDVGQSIIKDYVGRCGASSRIVLLGYSQGGQVMTSVLIGGQGRPALDADQKFITGGAFFASPSFRAGVEPIDAGNATVSGTFARDAMDYTHFNNLYGNKVRNYCQAGDEFCASGGFGAEAQAIHQREVGTYRDEATQFLLPLV